MANAFEEVLRIVLETQGEQGLDALRAAMEKVGDVSDDTIADTRKLIDQLNDLNATAGKAARFGQMADDFARTGEAMDNAQNATYQLTLRMGELSSRGEALAADHKAARAEVERLGAAMKEEGADAAALGKAHKAAQAEVKRLGAELRDNGKEIKATATAQQAARAEMEKLEGVYGKQAAALDKLDKELADSGRNTKDLGKLQGTLAAEIADATGDIQKQAAAMQAEAKAAAALRQRLDEGDEAFRKFAQAGTASAEALQRYRAGADAAASGSRNLAEQGGRLQGIFSGLRGLIAPVLAYLSFDAAKQGITNLLGVGSAAENARRSLQNLYGGVEAGNAAYAGLQDMAKKNGVAFNDLVETAKKLKAFGLDPLSGSLQALIDQNAAVGGSMQDLDGKVLALGKAWANQKLQGEEILQLVERGVPVWELLQKATGKNVQELQKLSEKGALGRDVIRSLYEELGKANSGAAERGLSSLSGLMAQVTARWEEFKLKVADAGVTDYFKAQLDALLGATGNMDALAKKVADSLIAVLDAIKVGAIFIADHVTALKELAFAYASFKVAGAVAQLNTWRVALLATAQAQAASTAAMAASGAGATRLAGLLRALPGTVQIAVALVGVQLAIRYAADLGEALAKLSPQERENEEIRAKSVQTLFNVAAGYKRQAEALNKYAATAVMAEGEVAKLTATERKAYQERLQGFQQYLEKVNGYYRAIEAAGHLTAQDAEAWGKVKDQLAGVEAGLKAVEAAGVAASKAGQDATAAQKAAIDEAIQRYGALQDAGFTSAAAIQGAFKDIKFTTPEGVTEAAGLLEKVAARGKEAGEAIRGELSGALSKVAVEDLPAVKAEADKAMAAGVAGAKEFAAAVDNAIKVAEFTQLGVDIEAIKTGFTAAGRSAVDAFRSAVDGVEDLGLTVEQRSRAIAQAFDAAFRQASTREEIAALKAALQDALSAGNIGFDEFQKRMVQADAKLAEVGKTGQKMGANVASGASQAASAMSSMSSAASGASGSVGKMGGEVKKAANAAYDGQPLISSYALAVKGLNNEAIKAMVSLNRLRVDGMTASGSVGDLRWKTSMEALTREMQEQYNEIQRLIGAAEDQSLQYDENAKRLAALRQQYKWLSDDELQRLIDAENKLKDGRERAAEDAKRQAEETAAAYEAQRKAAEEAEAARVAAGTIAGRSGQTAQQTAAVAERVIESAVEATQRMAKVAPSAELTLRVISEPTDGVRIQLTQQQLYEITSAVVRLINQSKSVST